MLHGAIFLATCNAILLLRDVKLPNTSLHYTPLMFSQHIENSSRKIAPCNMALSYYSAVVEHIRGRVLTRRQLIPVFSNGPYH
jgi:hypothetical protein